MFDQQEKQPDQNRIVAFLAEESHVPANDVAKLYEHERAELEIDAHIRTFLHIFAIRKVQEVLRKRQTEQRITLLADSALLAA